MQIVLFLWKKNPLSLDLTVFSPRYMNTYRFAGQLAVSSVLEVMTKQVLDCALAINTLNAVVLFLCYHVCAYHLFIIKHIIQESGASIYMPKEWMEQNFF